MGYHYFNEQLMDDLAVDLLRPEALVYAPGPHGIWKPNSAGMFTDWNPKVTCP